MKSILLLSMIERTMTQAALLLLLAQLGLGSPSFCEVTAVQDADKRSAQEDLDALLRKLGSGDIQVRDEATKSLLLRLEKDPSLETELDARLAKEKDGEIRARLEYVLGEAALRRARVGIKNYAVIEPVLRGADHVLLSPDGKWIATGGWDHRVFVFDVANGRQVASLDATSSVFSLAWDLNGQFIAAGTERSGILIWDSASWKLQRTFAIPKSVLHLYFDPPGDQLAAYTGYRNQGQLHLIRIKTEATVSTIDFSKAEGYSHIRPLGWCADGRFLVGTAKGPDALKLTAWNLEKGIAKTHWEGTHCESLDTMAVNEDGSRLAVLGESGRCAVWDTGKGKIIARPKAERWSSIVFPNKNEILLWSRLGHSVIRYRLPNLDERSVTKVDSGIMAVDARSTMLAVATTDGKTHIFNGSEEPTAEIQPTHRGSVRSATLSPDGSLVALTGYDGRLQIWSVKDRIELHAVQIGDRATGCDVSFTPDGRHLLLSERNALSIYEVKSLEKIRTIQTGGRSANAALAFHPDGNHIVFAEGEDLPNTLVLTTLEGKEKRRVRIRTSYIRTAQYTPKGDTIVVTSMFNLWFLDGKTMETRHQLPLERSKIHAAGCADDGEHFVTVTSSNEVSVWSLKERAVLARLPGERLQAARGPRYVRMTGGLIVAEGGDCLLIAAYVPRKKRVIQIKKIKEGQLSTIAVDREGKFILYSTHEDPKALKILRVERN